MAVAAKKVDEPEFEIGRYSPEVQLAYARAAGAMQLPVFGWAFAAEIVRRASARIPTGEVMEPGFDGEPPEKGVIRDFVYADGKREPTESEFNINHTRVSKLFAAGLLSDRQAEAARRFAKDRELALIQPTASAVLVGAGGKGGDMHPNDAKRAAMWRDGEACKLLGKHLGIVELVVIYGHNISKAAAMASMHRERASERLENGLDILVAHYRI